MSAPRPLVLAGAALLLAGSAGCWSSPVPDREPDVTGVVALTGEDGGPVLTEPSDTYYDGMSLVRGDPVVVRGGERGTTDALEQGDEVEVWIEGACAESFPVQCAVVAVRVPG